MSRPSLRSRLTRASLLTTLVVLVICAAALTGYELLTYRRAWVADLRTQADLIAHATAASIVFDDPKSAAENLRLLTIQPRVRAAAVYGADGKRFASYEASGADPLALRLEPSEREDVRFSGSTLDVVLPIRHDDQFVGSIAIRAMHDVWPRTATYAAILLTVMAIGLAIAAAVYRRLQREVTRPLVQMTEVAHEVMATRDWALRAPATEYEDIAVLVDAFNGMLGECQARTRELEVEMGERIHAEQELRMADRRKDEFLAMLGHELRNPLAPMSNALSLLSLPQADSEVRERSMQILKRQQQHLSRLIDDLLDVSRMSTGKLLLRTETVDAVAVLRECIDLARPAVAEKGVTLEGVGEAAPLWVDGDATRLSQVFSNLLSNACRYTPRGGRIDVRVERAGDVAEILVTDDGIGIDAAVQARVFDLFVQADQSLERGSAGLGVGLTLARHLARLHGGDILVFSGGLGKGAQFVARLPLVPAPVSVSAVPVHESASGASAHLAGDVLIADDNVDFALSLSAVLEAAGFAVRVVHDGASAVDAAIAQVPAVAILDIGMPRLNGYDVARELRRDPRTRSVKLIAVTGWGQPADKQAAGEAGFDVHLVKPVNPDAIIGLLTQLAA
jgi:signal transduction histidine kinase